MVDDNADPRGECGTTESAVTPPERAKLAQGALGMGAEQEVKR